MEQIELVGGVNVARRCHSICVPSLKDRGRAIASWCDPFRHNSGRCRVRRHEESASSSCSSLAARLLASRGKVWVSL